MNILKKLRERQNLTLKIAILRDENNELKIITLKLQEERDALQKKVHSYEKEIALFQKEVCLAHNALSHIIPKLRGFRRSLGHTKEEKTPKGNCNLDRS